MAGSVYDRGLDISQASFFPCRIDVVRCRDPFQTVFWNNGLGNCGEQSVIILPTLRYQKRGPCQEFSDLGWDGERLRRLGHDRRHLLTFSSKSLGCSSPCANCCCKGIRINVGLLSRSRRPKPECIFCTSAPRVDLGVGTASEPPVRVMTIVGPGTARCRDQPLFPEDVF